MSLTRRALFFCFNFEFFFWLPVSRWIFSGSLLACELPMMRPSICFCILRVIAMPPRSLSILFGILAYSLEEFSVFHYLAISVELR